jgi:DNA-binding XRE family transcriptional regulator
MAFDIKWVTAFTYDDPDKYGMFFTVKWTGRGRKKSREELKDELLERLGEDYEICHLAVGHSCLKPPAGLGAGWGSDGCAAPLAAFGLKERSSGFHSGLTPGGEPAQAMLGEERPGGPRSTGKDASMPHRKNRSLDGSLPSSPSTDSGEEIPSRSPAIAGIENARAKLRRAVAESGLTQEEIGIRMGMARSAARAGVSRILSHKNDPRLSTLLALAAALNCPLNDLL